MKYVRFGVTWQNTSLQILVQFLSSRAVITMMKIQTLFINDLWFMKGFVYVVCEDKMNRYPTVTRKTHQAVLYQSVTLVFFANVVEFGVILHFRIDSTHNDIHPSMRRSQGRRE